MLIDFSILKTSLLTGRENGKKAREKFGVEKSSIYIIKTSEDQMVTSSYFLGLLGEVLSSQFSSPKEALASIDFNGVNDKSRRECTKAIQRGLSSNRGLV